MEIETKKDKQMKMQLKNTELGAQEIDELKKLGIDGIARVIRKCWKNVNFAAKPYLDAMGNMISIRHNYGLDSGVSIVLYFLSNASTWRGPTAKAVKDELKRRVKATGYRL